MQDLNLQEKVSLTQQVRIIVIEDHSLVRDGICQLLDRYSDLKIVATANSLSEAVELTALTRPDIALLDIRLPDGVGYLGISQIQKANPDIRVLMVSAFNDLAYVQESLKSGASGYLLKTATGDELYDAIKTVISGATVLDSSLAMALALNVHPKFENLSVGLTEKELSILKALGNGLSNKQISDQIHVSVRTVEGYLSDLFDKIGVRSRTRAAIWAINNGIVSDSSGAVNEET